MRKLFTALVALSSVAVAWGGEAGGAGAEAKARLQFITRVRVLLDRGRQFPISSSGSALYVRPSEKADWLAFPNTVTLKPDGDGIALHGAWGTTRFLGPITLRAGGTPDVPLVSGARRFAGAIRAHRSGDKITLVNILPLEDYVAATVGAEMPASWELEALKAQAVLSRTFALNRLSRPRARTYDLVATVSDQAYAGVTRLSPRAREATRVTLGEYLAVTGRPILAHFHARCGGATTPGLAVWGHGLSFPGARCSYCLSHPARWDAAFPIATFRNIFNIPMDGRLGLEFTREPVSRRTLWARTGTVSVRLETLRRLLGPSVLKSGRLVEVEQQGDKVVVRGEGHGHGVGMCQWGANDLARRGAGYREILGRFFAGATLTGGGKREGIAQLDLSAPTELF